MADAHNWPNFVTGQQVWLDYIPADIAPLVSFDAHWGSFNKAQAVWFLKKEEEEELRVLFENVTVRMDKIWKWDLKIWQILPLNK